MPRRTRAPRPRAETKQATREALIAAALEEFAEVGLDAGLDTICARAGLTRGAFYVHFADREALILAVMQHVLGGFVSLLATTGGDVGVARALELFFTAARARAPEVHGGRALRFFHVMDACHRSRRVGETYRALIRSGRDRVASAIDADQQHGELRSDVSPAALADFMTVTALGVVAMLELELGLDLETLRATSLALVAPSETAPSATQPVSRAASRSRRSLPGRPSSRRDP